MRIILTSLLTITSFICFSQHSSEKKCKIHGGLIQKTGTVDNLRSDTIDVLNYKITLDFSNVSQQIIEGSCEVKFSALQNNINTLSLDLLQMTVDSVRNMNGLLNFSYNDTLLITELNTSLNTGEIDSITVFYHGHQVQDPSGWGGFYFQGNYSYNLGVGFGEDPHNYGRVWHPCFDNFVERATYEVTILTPSTLRGYSNGLIISEIDHGSYFERSWKLNQSIPSYLACVAVSNYTHVNQTYNSTVTGNSTPMYLIAEPADTSNFKSSFVHLPDAVDAFERQYGPYLWDKIGFHLVPFNSGAMEHATSIAYPKFAAGGGLSNETLMAHELSHHWWGDLITCRTDGDMWINEGMASYSERIFLEEVYGYTEYINDIKINHKDVLLNAHIRDEGYYAISGVPHDITYGDHSYNKGADVAHNLRTYMGDLDFFDGMHSFLNTNVFSDVDAYDFRDHLNANTGTNVTDFFDDWIFNPGFPGFIIDSTLINANGNSFDVDIYIHQKLKGTTHYFNSVPLEITFVDQDWSDTTLTIICSGEYSQSSVSLPFLPILTYLNGHDKLSEAVTSENQMIYAPVTKDLSYPMFKYTVTSASDSSLVRIEHYWVAPDPFKEPSNEFSYYLSQERFWKVDGIWTEDFKANARVFFNGKTGVGNELDINLTGQSGFHEDSLRVFYRESSSSEWQPIFGYSTQNIGSKVDGYGYITIDTLRKGEYTFGWRKSPLSTNSIDKFENLSVYPNPANSWITIKNAPYYSSNVIIQMFDSSGKLVLNQSFWSNRIFVGNLPKGIYYLKLIDNGLSSHSLSIIIE
ncbi:MAG: T9SS type A sorting domain-containing protein [Flavobacteriales bacterium]|nr:T9SS type A sorting domain-containing protein [Flavobacteriales bacterium]